MRTFHHSLRNNVAFTTSLAAAIFVIACGSDPGSGATTQGSGGTGAGTASNGAGAASGGVGGNQPSGGTASTGSGTGGDISFGGSGPGTGGAGGGPSCNTTIPATIRDFHVNHPDFEAFLGDDKGIVLPDLGADGKPVYAGNPTTPTTTGKANFDQWYRDVPGTNVAIPINITLTSNGNGTYTFDDQAFFPIDGQGFGNEGNTHNYHFTLELHTQFEYKGGEVFTFTGDDDLFTFINGKLAINLGGVHGSETYTVDLDAKAAELGIQKGKLYPIHFFFAERHTSESHFRIDTTIGCFTPPPTPK